MWDVRQLLVVRFLVISPPAESSTTPLWHNIRGDGTQGFRHWKPTKPLVSVIYLPPCTTGWSNLYYSGVFRWICECWECWSLSSGNSYSRDSQPSQPSQPSWCHNKQDIKPDIKTIKLLSSPVSVSDCAPVLQLKIFPDWDLFSVQKPWGDFTVNNKFVFVWSPVEPRPAGAIMFYRSNRDVSGIQKTRTQ